MQTYYFYLIRCSDDSLYSGVTTDLSRRLLEHNSQSIRGSKYVRSRQPAILVYHEKLSSKSKALKREAAVKKWSKEMKEQLVMRNV